MLLTHLQGNETAIIFSPSTQSHCRYKKESYCRCLSLTVVDSGRLRSLSTETLQHMRSFLKEWPQNPHWFGLMGAFPQSKQSDTTLSQHSGGGGSRVRHSIACSIAPQNAGRAQSAGQITLKRVILSDPPSLSFSIALFLSSVNRAHSSSATVSNARTLQCSRNCTPPASSRLYQQRTWWQEKAERGGVTVRLCQREGECMHAKGKLQG